MEDRTRFEILIESVQRDIKVIAEGHGALAERCDRSETRLARIEEIFDQVSIQIAVLEARVHVLETSHTALETKLESLSLDTQHRLKRVEARLGFSKRPRPGKRRRGSPKRPKAS